MTEERLRLLVKKQAEDRISSEERKELESYFTSIWLLDEDKHHVDWEALYTARIKPKTAVRRLSYRWAAAVAAILLVIGTVFLTNNYRQSVLRERDQQTAVLLENMVGGKEHAVLTLSSGEEFELEHEELTDVLDRIKSTTGGTVKTLTLTTPQASKYNFTLPDGTAVWLNANSEVSFPEYFAEDVRRIITKGEVYLEVVKDVKPFLISTHGIETKVLGTSLNINGYSSEEIFTTLFTGKVAVNNRHTVLELLPGQAVVAGSDKMQKYQPNMEKTASWRNNVFYFENEKLSSILSEFERWYDVQFEFSSDTKVGSKLYTGIINRDLSLQQVLEILNFSTSYKLTVSNNNIIHVQKIQ